MRTLTEQAEAVRNRQISPLELVEQALESAEAVQGSLNAFTVLCPDAVDRARELTDGPAVGMLHGVPVAVKDLYDVRGLPTTGCCRAFEDRVASRHSTVVDALLEQGAVVVAKTNQHELACGTTNQVSSCGPALNPWDNDRIPGGSSGGSAIAVATGVVGAAMGSDTGGSIRIPASFCGVTGLKPTHGAVSLRGVMPMTPSCDTAGPLAASASDCLLVLRAVAGFDPDDPYSLDSRAPLPPTSVDRLRITLPRSFYRHTDEATREATEAAARTLESLGCILDEVEGPDLDGTRDRFVPLLFAEMARHYPDLAGDERVSDSIRAALRLGASVSAPEYVAAREAALALRRDLEWLLTSADALLVPATPYTAPRIDELEVAVDSGTVDVHRGGPTRFTLPVNVTGLPALAFPTGWSVDGLPCGGQLIGAPWTEETLCLLGTAFQTATDHHLRTATV